jgi:hypothetical protein
MIVLISGVFEMTLPYVEQFPETKNTDLLSLKLL